MRSTRLVTRITTLVSIVCLMLSLPARGATVELTPIGTPAWSAVDFNLFAAPIGNAGNNYAEFFALGAQILPEPNHKNYPNVGIGPGAVHAPPYDSEISQGVAALGITEQSTFPVSDFSNGRGVNLAFMIVADGTSTGSSPEFASGPIIPNSLFPITVELHDLKNGVDFSEPGTLAVPSHTTLDPAFANLEGTSHFPMFFFDNADFAKDPSQPLAGSYAFSATLTDSAGNGYQLSAPFTIAAAPAVIPLPAAVWPGIALLTSLPIVRKLRRRTATP